MTLYTYNTYIEERTASQPTIINVDVTLKDVVQHTKEIKEAPIHIPELNKRVVNGKVYQLK